MKTTYETGLRGEETAENWLCEHRNMRPVRRRYRGRGGEIDLIMEDGETLVFVEVKTRLTGQPGEGLLAVDSKKQRRLARGAFGYLLETHQMNREVRFDVIEIHPAGIMHVPNAFQPGGMFFR